MKLKNYCILVILWFVIMFIISSQVKAKTFICPPMTNPESIHSHPNLLKEWIDHVNNAMYLTGKSWVYYCYGQYMLTDADVNTFEIISFNIAKDKNKVYFINSWGSYWWYASRYTIVSNDNSFDTKSLNLITGSLYDSIQYYTLGWSLFMITTNISSWDVRFSIVLLWMWADYSSGYYLNSLYYKWSPIMYGAPVLWAKEPIFNTYIWNQLAVIDSSWSIWRYKNTKNEVIHWEIDQTFKSIILDWTWWHRVREYNINKIDDYVISISWIFYVWLYDFWPILINNIDHYTFRPLGWWYYKDKNNIFFGDFVNRRSQKNLVNKNPTFGLSVVNADFNSFKYVWFRAKDKNNIYFWTGIWTGDGNRNINSFSWNILWYWDKNRFYYMWSMNKQKMLTWIDVTAIIPINRVNRVYKNNVYYLNSLRTWIDAKTLTLLDDNYFFDKNWVYFSSLYEKWNLTWMNSSWISILWYYYPGWSNPLFKNSNGIYLLSDWLWLIKLPIDPKKYTISHLWVGFSKWWYDSIEDLKYKCNVEIHRSNYSKNTSSLWKKYCLEK